MKLIIEIPEKTYHMINAGFYDYGDMNVIIQNGTPIPDNATNGDVIRAMFPNEHDFETDFDEEWWNAPYQRGGKVE